MKTTLDLPDELLRKAKATAAIRGESLRDFVASSLRGRLRREPARDRPGWKSVFGLAQAAEVKAIDRIVARELEKIEPAEWR